uniref:superoxide dismutase n=1 Tax=Lygus hesperus TaxID=30085 RepID=A0A0A9ZGJ1_LYGHE
MQEAGGIQQLFDNISKVATSHFGSGWAWLIINKDGKLEVKGYHDADTPIANGEVPLLTIDVWEHAYYIDYQNRRPNFVENFLKYLVNFGFIEENVTAYLAQK